jgi:hypothetical protein
MKIEGAPDILGLDPREDFDMTDDTQPGTTRVWFDVVSEFMPFLSEHSEDGLPVYKNFVYRFQEGELGRTSMNRRIRDKVEFDKATGKWVVKQYAKNKQSDIKKFPAEWNAFYNGLSIDDVGTPLGILIKNDPAKIKHYAHFSISTIERLASINDSDASTLGMGALDDRSKARRFLERAKGNVDGIQINTRLDEMAKALSTKDAQIADLTAKLTEVLQAQLEGEGAPVKKGKKQTVVEA